MSASYSGIRAIQLSLHANHPTDPRAPFEDPFILLPDVADLRGSYLKLIGQLIYLSTNSRPDIAYIVDSLVQLNANPSTYHFAAAQRILRYLAGTINHRLCYGYEIELPELHAYADASWANEAGRPSVSGYAWFYSGGLSPVTHVIREGL